MDALRKVQPGAPLQIPAKAYNAFVDAALDHQQRRMSTSADPQRDRDPANIVLVKNESGADRSRFDVLGVTGPIFTRADNAATFQSRIALRGVTPAAAHAGRFVVLVDALPDGTIGRAYVSGACLARVRMLDEDHISADVDDGQAGQLASSDAGAASLIWVEPLVERDDPAIAWAVIRFGGGGSTGTSSISTDGQSFLALLKSVQRFSEDVPALPAYHWKEAEISAGGAAQEKIGGQSSKQIPSCDSFTVNTENASYAALADPASDGVNLTNASVEEGATLSFRLTATEDTTHTVTEYQIRVGIAFSPPGVGGASYYGTTGSVPPGSPATLQVAGIPLNTDIYVTILTVTSDAGTQANRYIIQAGLNGEASPAIAVEPETINDADGAALIAPVAGNYTGTIEDDLTDLSVEWTTAPGATHYYVTAGTGSGDPNTDPTTWNLADHDVGAATSDLLTDVPADGTDFYVVIWWRTAPSFDWSWNRWKITITPAADRRAINDLDINRITTESMVGYAGLVEIPDPPTEGDPPEEIETELDVPILVRIWKTIDAAGNDRFVFSFVEQEFVAEILAESEPDAADDFDDARYWLKMIKVANSDPDNAPGAPLTFADATHAAARVISAENLSESAAGTHELDPGTRVMVRSMRGGDKPWITRFVFNCGGTGGGARFLAKIQSAGPNAEADYTDARYWVQEVDVRRARGTRSKVPGTSSKRTRRVADHVGYGQRIEEDSRLRLLPGAVLSDGLGVHLLELWRAMHELDGRVHQFRPDEPGQVLHGRGTRPDAPGSANLHHPADHAFDPERCLLLAGRVGGDLHDSRGLVYHAVQQRDLRVHGDARRRWLQHHLVQPSEPHAVQQPHHPVAHRATARMPGEPDLPDVPARRVPQAPHVR